MRHFVGIEITQYSYIFVVVKLSKLRINKIDSNSAFLEIQKHNEGKIRNVTTLIISNQSCMKYRKFQFCKLFL